MKKSILFLTLMFVLMAAVPALAANTGSTNAIHSQTGAKVTGAPLTHALGGRGMLFGNTKPDFTPPVGWTGEAVIDDPPVFEKTAPGIKGVKKGDVVQVQKMGPDKYKLIHPGTGKSVVVTTK